MPEFITQLQFFILGLGNLVVLIFTNYVILHLCKTFPKHILSMSGVMIALDAIVLLGYTLTIYPMVVEYSTPFMLAVGLSIFIALVHKTVVFQKTFKEMFKNEIGN